MSCESECRCSDVAFESNENSRGFRKDLRISYTRDYLLSLAEVNVTQALPSGFDRSILSELDDACKSAHEHQKLPDIKSLFTGRTWGDSSRYSSEKWGSFKMSSEDSKYTGCKANRFLFKIAPEHQKLPLLESPFTGKICSDSSWDVSEKWGSCKLSSKDSKSIDHGKFYSNQSHCSWKKPESTAILRLVQNSEQNGILGSWSASKLLSPRSEVSISKIPGTDSCLLSRCKEPYRPPSFYKAMNHYGILNHDTSSNEASGCAECPSKERAMEGNWKKDTCLVLEEHPTVPAITSQNNPPPVSPAISGSVESPWTAGEDSEQCHTEEPPDHHPLIQDPVVQQLPSKSQLIQMDSGVEVDVEKLQGQILEGGRFSALINLEEAEDIDAYFLDEANLTSNDCSRDIQSVKEGNMGFGIIEKKELRNHASHAAKSKETKIIDDNLQVKAMKKATSNSLAVEPSDRASCLLTSVAQDWKGIDAPSKELYKANAPLALGPDHSDSEIWQSTRCIKKHDVMVDGRDSYRSKSKFIHWFPENEKSDCGISSGAEKDGWKVWGAPTRKSMKENHLGQRKPEEASTYGQKAQCSEKTRAGGLDFLGSDHAEPNNCYPDDISHDSRSVHEYELDKVADDFDLCLELNLPDENSLITIDDIYIFEQEEPKPPEISTRGGSVSPFPGSSKLIGSESVQQNLTLPDPWFHESHLNSKNLLVDPSVSLAHVNSPPTFHDPWRNNYNDYNPFAYAPPPFERQPLKPRNYEPVVKNFLSPRMQQADDYCPDLDKILSADPSSYHQFLQTPCSNEEPNVLRSLPLNYQTNVKSTMDMGKRGLLAEERVKSAINHYLQIQIKLAQRDLEAAERRAYSKAVSNRFW